MYWHAGSSPQPGKPSMRHRCPTRRDGTTAGSCRGTWSRFPGSGTETSSVAVSAVHRMERSPHPLSGGKLSASRRAPRARSASRVTRHRTPAAHPCRRPWHLFRESAPVPGRTRSLRCGRRRPEPQPAPDRVFSLSRPADGPEFPFPFARIRFRRLRRYLSAWPFRPLRENGGASETPS